MDSEPLFPPDIEEVLSRFRVLDVTIENNVDGTVNVSSIFEATEDPIEQARRNEALENYRAYYKIPSILSRICDCCDDTMPMDYFRGVLQCSGCFKKFDLCEDCATHRFTLHCPSGFGCKKSEPRYTKKTEDDQLLQFDSHQFDSHQFDSLLDGDVVPGTDASAVQGSDASLADTTSTDTTSTTQGQNWEDQKWADWADWSEKPFVTGWGSHKPHDSHDSHDSHGSRKGVTIVRSKTSTRPFTKKNGK